MSKQMIVLGMALGLVLLPWAGGAEAAPGDAAWIRHASGEFVAVAASPSGGAAVGAYFYEPTDFGGGIVSPVTFGDLAVMHYDASGALSWLVHIVPLNGGFAGFQAADTDSTGAIYLTGTLAFGAIDFGGGELAAPGNEGFLVKFDATGAHVWSRLLGDLDPGTVAVTGDRVCVIGTSAGTVDLGGGPLVTNGPGDAFAGVFDLDGTPVWGALWGDAGQQAGLGGGLDAAGNLTLAVGMEGAVDFGGGLLAAAATDLGLASFDPSGQHRWSMLFTGNFAPWPGWVPGECRVGADGRSVLTGWYDGTVDLGGGPMTGAADAFVAVHDTDGSLVWSRQLANPDQIETYGVSVGADGSIAVSGVFGGAPDFGGGPLSGPGGGDLFLAVYGPAGAHRGSWAYGSPGYDDFIVPDHTPSGDLLIRGVAGAGADFGLGPSASYGAYLGRVEGAAGGPTSGVGDVPGTVTQAFGHPNPFNPTTTISYTVAHAANVSVAAYDVRGRLVQVLVDERPHDPGRYDVRFRAGASGVYLVRVRADGEEQVVKVTAVK